MRMLITAAVSELLQLLIFFSLGSLLMHLFRCKADASLSVAAGYIVYFSLFELVNIPATLMWMPLGTFSRIWAAVLAVLMVLCIFLLHDRWKEELLCIPSVCKEHGGMLLAVGAVIALQCLIVVFYADSTVDAAYYIGTVSTSVYTDTMGRYNPYTGNLLKAFQSRYILSAYPMHNAVWSHLTGVHPIIQSKEIMNTINVLAANLTIFQIGKALFDQNRKKADLMVVFVCLLQLFSYTIYTTGTFFFTRTYEGKALLGSLSIPLVLLCAVWLWKQTKEACPGEIPERMIWGILFLTSLSAVAFSGSAIIFPIVIAAGIFPVALAQKRFRWFVCSIICMLPSICYACVFFGAKMGLISLRAS